MLSCEEQVTLCRNHVVISYSCYAVNLEPVQKLSHSLRNEKHSREVVMLSSQGEFTSNSPYGCQNVVDVWLAKKSSLPDKNCSCAHYVLGL